MSPDDPCKGTYIEDHEGVNPLLVASSSPTRARGSSLLTSIITMVSQLREPRTPQQEQARPVAAYPEKKKRRKAEKKARKKTRKTRRR